MAKYGEKSPVVEYLRGFQRRTNEGKALADITGEEAAQRYEQIIFKLDLEGLEKTLKGDALDVFAALPASQRVELGTMLRTEAEKLFGAEKQDIDTLISPADYVKPDKLATVAFEIEKAKRGSLVDVFAQGQGQKKLVHEWANTPVAKKTLGGIAGRAAKRVLPS